MDCIVRKSMRSVIIRKAEAVITLTWKLGQEWVKGFTKPSDG